MSVDRAETHREGMGECHVKIQRPKKTVLKMQTENLSVVPTPLQELDRRRVRVRD